MLGHSQIAGQIQSPRGNLATTSTLPYRMLFFPLVLRRADRTGGIIVPFIGSELTIQDVLTVPVQLPSLPRSSV